ncbi:hypothetical protein NG791_17650 [Laspinema sp. D1]|nr:hypothetical protein [Laspinema sp. D2b]
MSVLTHFRSRIPPHGGAIAFKQITPVFALSLATEYDRKFRIGDNL